MFVARAKYTYANKGAKRVRQIGIGASAEKSQVTCTLFCTEDGEVLPVQMIFGGKTNACHPNKGRTAPPEGFFYDHTESHWQTPASFINVIKNILIPYRLAMIRKHQLPESTKMLFKLDLHYSHHDDKVKELCVEVHIILFFVPGKCTDELQECDVVLNFPFKMKVKCAFRDYLHSLFELFAEQNPEIVDEWVPDLKISALKPHITSWVQKGVDAVRTPAMKEAIKKAFAIKGGFTEIRRRALQMKAAAQRDEAAELDDIAALLANMFADAPRGDEEEEERLDDIGLDNILEVHEDAQGEEVNSEDEGEEVNSE